MPRGGTTVAAKFMSLHTDMFCCASETHLVPLLHGLFRQHPCRPEKLQATTEYLQAQLLTAMVEIPRFNVSQGAHPGNLIFDEACVDALVSGIKPLLASGKTWTDLHGPSLDVLRALLAERTPRTILGEKTPSNVFAMAEAIGPGKAKPVLVVREPFGALRSMRRRSDPYGAVFSGDTESNIGIYLEYGHAIKACLEKNNALLIRYEEMAKDPANALRRMFGLFGLAPEARVVDFVEHGGDQEIADRAPVNYKRLAMDTNHNRMTRVDAWKVLTLTRDLRTALGYSDEMMAGYGLPFALEWPGDEVPAAILPLCGFHAADSDGNRWMKQQARLAAYLPTGSSRNVCLKFWSCFPDEVLQGQPATLTVLVAGKIREQIPVPAGPQGTTIVVTLSDDLLPMGASGHFVELTLHSSVTFTPLTTAPDSLDVRDVSLLFNGGAIA